MSSPDIDDSSGGVPRATWLLVTLSNVVLAHVGYAPEVIMDKDIKHQS